MEEASASEEFSTSAITTFFARLLVRIGVKFLGIDFGVTILFGDFVVGSGVTLVDVGDVSLICSTLSVKDTLTMTCFF